MPHPLLAPRHRPAPPGRLEVCPPGLLPAEPSRWRSLWRWLRQPAPLAWPNRLEQVRADFIASLHDVPGEAPVRVLVQLQRARSLRELWHLRPAVFMLLCRTHTEHEATERLARLNRHFPTRSPRSGFAPLDTGSR